MIDKIKLLYQYNDWVNEKIFEMSKQLTEEHLQKPVNFSEGSYIKILAHMLEAHDVWLRRILGEEVKAFHFLDTSSLSNLIEFYHQLKIKTFSIIDNLSQEDLNKSITYRTTQGNIYTNTIFEILFHILNHSNTHRSQLKLLLKDYQVNTQNIDYIFFSREKNS
jgi:uncharacterized damage-inducible protein DinB